MQQRSNLNANHKEIGDCSGVQRTVWLVEGIIHGQKLGCQRQVALNLKYVSQECANTSEIFEIMQITTPKLHRNSKSFNKAFKKLGSFHSVL